MTRVMYDSVDPGTIPASAQMVAGYVDLNYAWSAAGWAKWAHVPRVRIAASPFTNDGHAYDFEPGNDMTPANLVNWIAMRRAAKITPAVYMDAGHWPLVQQIVANARITPPLYWVAHWGISPVIPPGAIGLQYRNTPGWDESVVADYWPSVDPTPTPTPAPPGPAPAPAPLFGGIPDMMLYAVAATDTHALAGTDANPGIWLMSGELYVHMANPTDVINLTHAGVPQVPISNAQHLLFKAGTPKTA